MNGFLFIVVSLLGPQNPESLEVIDLGTRRELFVDHFLVEKLEGAHLELHHPVRKEVVLRFDRPWEGLFCGYFTVLHDQPKGGGKGGGRYLFYYRGLPASRKGEADHRGGEVTCVAESEDGIHFRRPSLGIYEVNGTRENNVILASHPACHNFSPFIDTRPGVPEDQSFKALGGNRRTGLIAFASQDGIHWREIRKEPVIIKGAFDSQNVAFWSPAEECYLSYFRIFEGGVRSVARAASEDFLNWTDPVAMTYGGTPREHLYTNQTHPYFRVPHIYISLPKRFHPGRRAVIDETVRDKVASAYRDDCSDGVFMTTRGGNRYDRTFMEAFFRPGLDPGNWVSRVNMATLGVVQTGKSEMSMYYSQHYAQPTHHVLRCTLRLDGFASLQAPYRGGELLTKPFRFSGSRLVLNLSTSAAGSVRVELQDVHGKAVPGHSLEECPEIVGDKIEHVVSWKGGSDLAGLAGKPVKMRLALKDADVFSFRFAPAEEPGKTVLMNCRKIWDQAPHNAFTDLLHHEGSWYCVFREAKGHVSPDGKIRVISSRDGREWESAALLAREGSDLRDPKIEVIPDGRLMILAAASWHDREAPISRQPMVWFSKDGSRWTDGVEVAEPNFWLWRVTWHKGTGRGIGYGCGKENRRLRLYETPDGIDYTTLVENLFDAGYPNETAIRFVEKDRALCLLRRDGNPNTALFGLADPPYTTWTWKDLGVRIGGPNMIRLPCGRIVAAVRLYDKNVRTALCWLDTEAGTLTEFLTLPSGGDTSYAGLAFHEGLLWISYYSSHQGKTSIYLARARLPEIGEKR